MKLFDSNIFKRFPKVKSLGSIGLLALMFVLMSCTKTNGLFDAESGGYRFPGLNTVKINSDGTLLLSWDKIQSKEAIKYGVFEREYDRAFDYNSPIEIISSETYRIGTFSLNKRFCYAVRYYIVGIEPDTNSKEICPDLPYVASFGGIEGLVATGAGGVTVSWNQAATAHNIVGYNIYKDGDFANVYASVSASESEKIVSGLPVDTQVTFAVRAVDEYGRTDSNTKTLSVDVINNAPLVFSGIQSATQVGSRSVKLTWLAPAGSPTEYRLYKTTGSYGATPTMTYASVFQTISKSLKEVTVTDLGDEQAHCFVLRSVSTGGQEDTNTEAKCVQLADAGAPLFSGLTSATFSGGAAQIIWDEAVGEVVKYKVYYKSGTSMDYAAFDEVSAPASSYSKTGLPDNQDWTFAVRAVDSRNQIDANSEKRTIHAGDLTAPIFNGLVSLTAVTGSETQLTVTFNKSNDVDLNYYRIRYRQTGQTSWQEASSTIAPAATATISATLNGLLPATSYDVYVRAFDTSGNPSTNTAYLTRTTNDATPPTFNGISNVSSKPGDI